MYMYVDALGQYQPAQCSQCAIPKPSLPTERQETENGGLVSCISGRFNDVVSPPSPPPPLLPPSPLPPPPSLLPPPGQGGGGGGEGDSKSCSLTFSACPSAVGHLWSHHCGGRKDHLCSQSNSQDEVRTDLLSWYPSCSAKSVKYLWCIVALQSWF